MASGAGASPAQLWAALLPALVPPVSPPELAAAAWDTRRSPRCRCGAGSLPPVSVHPESEWSLASAPGLSLLPRAGQGGAGQQPSRWRGGKADTFLSRFYRLCQVTHCQCCIKFCNSKQESGQREVFVT